MVLTLAFLSLLSRSPLPLSITLARLSQIQDEDVSKVTSRLFPVDRVHLVHVGIDHRNQTPVERHVCDDALVGDAGRAMEH
jgi:hypothetical protein